MKFTLGVHVVLHLISLGSFVSASDTMPTTKFDRGADVWCGPQKKLFIAWDDLVQGCLRDCKVHFKNDDHPYADSWMLSGQDTNTRIIVDAKFIPVWTAGGEFMQLDEVSWRFRYGYSKVRSLGRQPNSILISTALHQRTVQRP